MSDLLFTPIEASNAAENYTLEIQNGDSDAMPLYIPKMEYSKKTRKGFLPVNMGELITITGRPGHGKTGFMLWLARQRANYLKSINSNKVVLFWTMEQLVEELRLFHVAAETGTSATDMLAGDVEWDSTRKALRNLHTIPLWLAGKSRERRRNRIPLDEKSFLNTLLATERWQDDNEIQGIDCVFVDYLQRFRAGGKDWTQFYGDMVNSFKDLAGDFSTRIFLGVQAKREVDKYELQIPQMDDGQWTSGIEQQADGMISVCRPSKVRKQGDTFDDVVVRGHNQMIIAVTKRKNAPADFQSLVNFAPEYNKLDEAEVINYNFRKAKGEDE